MIVLNEHEWAKEMIRSHTLGKKPHETIRRVAQYYLEVEGYTKKQTRKALDTFIIQCDPNASLPKWSNALDYAVSHAAKTKLVNIDHIDITKPELEKITALPGKQLQRLAFTLLCLAKYWNTINPNGDSWVNTKDSDIMRMANIGTSIKRQSLLYNTLHELGMVQFSKKVNNTNVRVLFLEDGETVLSIYDFRNLGYQCMKAQGEPYFTCQNCGITVRTKPSATRKKQIYCRECAAKIQMQQIVNAVMKSRVKRKS